MVGGQNLGVPNSELPLALNLEWNSLSDTREVPNVASILFITFDCKKPEYSQISYSTASMIAALCTEQVDVKVFPLDVKHGLNGKRKQGEAPSVEPWVLEELERNRSYFGSFDYLAIPLTAWTEQYVEKFLETLAEYGGKVILGGYEVTALSDEALQSRFPRADYYIKGYAEGVLRKLIVQGWEPSSKVIHGKVDEADLASPYLSGVLNTYSKSIHWETTRGCPFKCGF
jgi:hypothetical protein